MADSREHSASGFLKLRKLHEKLQWPYFKSSLEDLMYMYAKISKMEDISKGRMADFAFFKKEDIDSYKDALDGGDTTSSGDDSMPSMTAPERKKKKDRLKKRVARNKEGKFTDEFIEECYAMAVEKGDGFLPWVYKVYVAVKDALSEAILDQVAGCQRGDLITLWRNSKWRSETSKVSTPPSSTLTSCKPPWHQWGTTICSNSRRFSSKRRLALRPPIIKSPMKCCRKFLKGGSTNCSNRGPLLRTA